MEQNTTTSPSKSQRNDYQQQLHDHIPESAMSLSHSDAMQLV